VGYLLGARDGRAAALALLGRVAPLVVARAARGEYRHLRASLPFLARLALEPAPHAPAGRFPAHLHLNLLPAARGRGLGLALMRAYLGRLEAAGVPGVQLSTT
jgi:GNAT superfamily N-acetyltransferase